MRFEDRIDAGRQLARRLQHHRAGAPVVVGLTRGGVPVAAEVARALGAELDALVVRKLGAPIQPELGMGAIAEGGGRWVDPSIVAITGTTEDELVDVETRERALMQRRITQYRAAKPRVPLRDRTVILVDDGIATGGTVRAALQSIRNESPRAIVLAVPVAAVSTLEALERSADEVVCVEPRHDLHAIGLWYRDFSQVDDGEVVAALRAARAVRETTTSP
ncbi:phosphoribosyltransferase [Sandaracinus amylolyticus]|uniref:Phosphoribosyl transferase domain protein n=1 Tax=Sandaracinus amylolyticus TaxID=927083 RepID=A0A0F6SD72_9BACT|nr:phosphoribosyltransferase family protein [Sandaracinus amylolyticus]AKF02939.1 Phosphoribosyl transferase domain protein [Sandaracinus amylolyticus]